MQGWRWCKSPVSRVVFRGQRVHVKRDDVFHLAGNKMRKMYWFVRQRDEFFSDAHLLSFGGSQSNAMLALAQLADARQVPFTYFSRELCLREEQEEGNLALAMSLGMKHVQLHPDAYHELVRTRDFAAFLDGELRLPPGTRSLYVPQGAAFPEAQDGVKLLAEEINEYVETQDKRFSVVLPCGTGTTALYLAQHLHPEIKLYAVPCVGDAAYLQLQFRQLIDEDPTLQLQTALLPQVLTPERKSHFGRLWWPLHDMYHEVLQETEVDFDLVLGVASRLDGEVREEDSTGSERELMYIHTGGTSGNATMLARYRRKDRQA
ncbi:uncharacterized protein KRP23_1534 [Phytophthora ramorum]|uniref:uncharacterized protein n=1 Tax=Phytophthora ramorum TaxID=164328 RepID=UPI0030B77379|nr:hypothetical protein KRP23_1534 [Phytophthora ramorum]